MKQALNIALKAVILFVIFYWIGMKVASAQIPSREIVRLNSNNTVLLRGEITEASVLDVSLDLAKVVAKRGFKLHPIYLVIDSPGGEIDAGIAFIEFAKIVPNLRTITIFAASMAAFTVEGLPGNRLITNNGVLMFHRARGQISGQIEVGELETRLAFTKKQILGMENVSAARLGLNIFQYKANVKDEWWMDADDSLRNKAADKIVDISCSQELIDKRVKVTEASFFGSVTKVYSGCPTFRSGKIEEK